MNTEFAKWKSSSGRKYKVNLSEVARRAALKIWASRKGGSKKAKGKAAASGRASGGGRSAAAPKKGKVDLNNNPSARPKGWAAKARKAEDARWSKMKPRLQNIARNYWSKRRAGESAKRAAKKAAGIGLGTGEMARRRVQLSD
jgi:hypothetical protein